MKDCWILTNQSGEPMVPASGDDLPDGHAHGMVMVAFTDKRDAEQVRDWNNSHGLGADIRLLSEIEE